MTIRVFTSHPGECLGGAWCEIYASDDDMCASTFDVDIDTAVRGAVAQFRAHRRWLRRQRMEVSVDPIVELAQETDAVVQLRRNRAMGELVRANFRVDNDVEAATCGPVDVDADGRSVA